MRIKKFVGPDMKDVTNQMKKDLGPDAIVLNTRRLTRGGILGALGTEMVEITGAIDELEESESPSYRSPIQAYTGMSTEDSVETLTKSHAIPRMSSTANQSSAVQGIRQIVDQFEKKRSEGERPIPHELKEQAEFYHLKADVEDIKTSLNVLTLQLKQQQTPPMPEQLRRVFEQLVDHEVPRGLAGDIVGDVLNSNPGIQLQGIDRIEERLLQAVAGRVKTGIVGRAKSKRPRVVMLVGPTGVGKTTTIAKLAARDKLVNHKKVGLMTADTYRIGAIEQLRTFAAIADIPMEVIYRASDVAVALKKLSANDVLYVDTVGRNQKAKKDLTDLRKIVEALKPDEVHLVLSAPTSASTLDDIVKKYALLNPNNIIVSKVDEAVTFGPMFNIVQHQKFPVSYFTTGQGVPDDIMAADGIKFALMVYRGVVPNG